MENLKIEISANAVAWYGAIIATLSIILSFLNYFRDKAKIKVKISQRILAYKNHNLGNELQILIEAINIGRRAITLSGAGLTLKNRENISIIGQDVIKFPY